MTSLTTNFQSEYYLEIVPSKQIRCPEQVLIERVFLSALLPQTLLKISPRFPVFLSSLAVLHGILVVFCWNVIWASNNNIQLQAGSNHIMFCMYSTGRFAYTTCAVPVWLRPAVWSCPPPAPPSRQTPARRVWCFVGYLLE